MRRDHAQRRSFAVDYRVDRAARLAASNIEVDLGYRDDRKARQQPVAEVAVGAADRRSGDRMETGFALQVREHVETARAQFDFLQGDDVGVDLGEHARDAFRREAPVDADCAVRVVRNDDGAGAHAPRGQASAPARRRRR